MIATYRLQLLPEFRFSDVEALIPYLQRLGVSHLYLSPITEARSGSTHGYDVTDHNRVREELGGEEGLDRLLQAVREAGLEVILDFVPNHAGVGPHNEAWQDVLAYGRHSARARDFDIDWSPLEETLDGKVLLPFLGKPYGEALDAGEIQLGCQDGRFYATYYEDRFALSPASYAPLVDAVLPAYERTETYFDLKELRDAYAALALEEVEKANMLGRRLQAAAEGVDWAAALDGFPRERLHAVLEQQHWRLAYWKTASYEINYRRFFDVNALVALRMEDEEVFWKAHRLIGEIALRDGVAGVRIDHVDGLFDPHSYLTRLRDLGVRQIWVEKILARGEILPDDWPVEGTTGYEFMNDVMSVLLNPAGVGPLHRTYERFVPEPTSFADEVHDSKRLVMETSLSSELFRLAHELNRLCKADYHTRDFSLGALLEALTEVVAALDRYRTYLPHDAAGAKEVLQKAAYRARQRTPAFEPSVFDFIVRVVLGEVPDDLKQRQQAWTGRFQQYTAPVAAKGVEDTAFYRYLPFVALNEVGGEPEPAEHALQAFHSHAAFRAHRYPSNLLATATHDHKRGEDTRMRLIALAEVPEVWEEALRALSAIGETYRSLQGPSRYDEYLFYQLLCAVWDENGRDQLQSRLYQYMQKATRESKRRTSWNNPDEAYERSLDEFVRGVLGDERTAGAVGTLARTVAELGFTNSITQVVLKMTSPGVPDIYQGAELFDLSLVDPDNRRPVDYGRREALLRELESLLDRPESGQVRSLVEARSEMAKFYMTARLLRLRRDYREILTSGSYRPLEIHGPDAEGWLAFARELGDAPFVVAVPRFPKSHEARDAAVVLPESLAHSKWQEMLTGTRLDLGETLDVSVLPLPWAVLAAA